MNSATSVPSANVQLFALVGQRWRMIRSHRVRWSLVALALVPAVLVAAGLWGVRQLPEELGFNVSLATPTLYLAFVFLAILAPLVSGGGYELYPSDQLVAYPIRPSTVFRGTLALAPINLAWILNAIALFVITGLTVGPLHWARTSRALLVILLFIGLATTFGHALGWFVMGVRQNRRGRIITNVVAILCGLAILIAFWTERVFWLLDHSPTQSVLIGAFRGYEGDHSSWLLRCLVLMAAILATIRIGDAAAAWALRRPGDHADRTSSRRIERRQQRRHPLLALFAIDHASVWRSVPLRRGALVLLIVPGAVAALVGLTWQSLILVPGLIAAGAGLLFGINAFALDSGGSVWLSTLPNWTLPAFWSKALTFMEIAAGAVLSALVGGSLRAHAPASAADVTSAICSALICALLVVAMGMRSSLTHPHRAELSGPRDTPATPGVMALQSVRFAVVTTFAALYFGMLALSRDWWVPLLGSVPIACLATLHLLRTLDAWQHPHVRSHVVTTVAGG